MNEEVIMTESVGKYHLRMYSDIDDNNNTISSVWIMCECGYNTDKTENGLWALKFFRWHKGMHDICR